MFHQRTINIIFLLFSYGMQSHKQQEMYARIDIEGNATKKKHNNKIENTNIRDFYCYFFSRIILLDVWIVLHLVYGLPIMKKTMFINSAPANRTGKIDIVTTVTLVVIQNSSWDHTFFRGNEALPNVLWVPKSDVTICVHHGTRWITQKQPRWQ